ncbi:60S ribosomal protein L13 [Naegleria gruberi]|uniref:60S ribosomal protein L13 n=1 Tax=Naegleria gruberi TaxID=5762 RepID=D2V5T7_NAEGR|nr:60S ribosomal protein L13 [Naegleria gruberi]EFC47710.1 60S ribosomal protein L13 [Naegleria gruberi]|eukprot:XP_002680454.1 60S ribosomal protein L13 [Naegleria gruberi strain NEG-M]
MVSHNNAVPQSKWKKQWTNRVKLFFDGPAKAKKRQELRIKKAKNVFPRPTELLRPVVRLSGRRYNRRVALGRGFSVEELKQAGIPLQFAKTVGIAIDTRRKDLSEERLQANVQRLQEYKQRVVLFPRKKGTVKKGPIADAQVAKAESQVRGTVLPVKREVAVVETRDISAQEKESSAVKSIVKARKSIKQFSYLQKKKNKAVVATPAGAVVADE